MARQVRLPTFDDPFLAMTRDEVENTILRMDTIMQWSPPTHVAQACPDRVAAMRQAADRFRANLFESGNEVDTFVASVAGGMSMADQLEVASVLRGFAGGSVLPIGWLRDRDQAISLYNDLRTVGCQRALGVPLAILGGFALAVGGYAWWKSRRKRRAA